RSRTREAPPAGLPYLTPLSAGRARVVCGTPGRAVLPRETLSCDLAGAAGCRASRMGVSRGTRRARLTVRLGLRTVGRPGSTKPAPSSLQLKQASQLRRGGAGGRRSANAAGSRARGLAGETPPPATTHNPTLSGSPREGLD